MCRLCFLLLLALLTLPSEPAQAQPRKARPTGRRTPRSTPVAHPFAQHDSLLYAVATGNLARARQLLEAGVDASGRVSKADSAGFDPSSSSSFEGRVVWLPDWQFVDTEELPLTIAMQAGNLDMMKLLLAHGANPEASLGRALGYLPRQVEAVRLLLASGARPDSACPAANGNGALAQLLSYNEGMRTLAAEQQARAAALAKAWARARPGNLAMSRIRVRRRTRPVRYAPPSILPLRADSVTAAVLQLLVEAGANPQLPPPGPQDEGRQVEQPLHIAMRCGETQAVHYLVTHGAMIDTRTALGATALQMAVQRNDEALTALLLAQGANPNALDRQGNSPLHIAAQASSPAIVKRLLAAGAEATCLTDARGLEYQQPWFESINMEGGASPLGLAAQAGRTENVRVLLEAGVDANNASLQHRTPLLYSVLRSRQTMQPDGIEPAPPVESTSQMEDGAQSAESKLMSPPSAPYEIEKLLLVHGADPNRPDAGGETPLRSALIANDTLLVRLLLEHRANPNFRNALGDAVIESVGSLAALRLLQVHGGKLQPSQYQEILFRQSANQPLVRVCLAAGASVAAPDWLGIRPLHHALEWRPVTPELLALYLSHGAPPDDADSSGCTPLVLAARSQSPAVVEQLLAAGARPNGTPLVHPLHEAAAQGRVATVQVLLRQGAQPNLLNAEGRTALHEAFAKNLLSPAIFRMLLDAGANPNAVDTAGTTPLQMCIRSRWQATVFQYNRSHGYDNDQDPEEVVKQEILANEEFMEIACLLLARGALPSIPAKDGKTALAELQEHQYEEPVFRSLLAELGQSIPSSPR